MKINRTCEIELSAEEVRDAITKYVREQYRFRSSDVKSWEECLSVPITGLVVTWGENPEEAETERDEPPSSGITCSEAACRQVGDEHNPDPMAFTRG